MRAQFEHRPLRESEGLYCLLGFVNGPAGHIGVSRVRRKLWDYGETFIKDPLRGNISTGDNAPIVLPFCFHEEFAQ